MNNQFDENYKRKLKEVFKNTIDFFDKYNIHYWASGGTVIGAVRHKDIIPWDDDVDIYMTRSEFNRLCNLQEELFSEKKYKCISIYNCVGYQQLCAKIYDTNTTVWEQKLFPVIYGVWVDIFILDEYEYGYWKYGNDLSKLKSKFSKYQQSVADYSITNIVFQLLKCNFSAFRNQLNTKFISKQHQKKLLNEYLDAENKWLQNRDCENAFNYVCLSEGSNGVYNKNIFGNGTKMIFDDFDIIIPEQYDDYLTFIYGDYMTPPPENKRFSGHTMVYVNLNEGLTMDEVNKRISQNEISNGFIQNNGHLLKFTLKKQKHNSWL